MLISELADKSNSVDLINTSNISNSFPHFIYVLHILLPVLIRESLPASQTECNAALLHLNTDY